MFLRFSLDYLSVAPSTEWSATLIGIGFLVGLLFGFWLGTYLVISKDPEKISLAEEPYEPTVHKRKPTVTRAENLARERHDLARLPEK